PYPLPYSLHIAPSASLPLTPPPLAPPLLPYTTLFRSSGAPEERRAAPVAPAPVTPVPPSTARAPVPRPSLMPVPRPVSRPAARKDRKSTRLNSSHQIIYFAVFCLYNKQ